MAEDRRKIGLGVGLVAVVGGLALLLARKAKAEPPPEEGMFSYVSTIKQVQYESAPGQPWSQHALVVQIDVKNTGTEAGVCVAQPQMACAAGNWEWTDITSFLTTENPVIEAIIQPGQTITFWGSCLDSPRYGYTCVVRFIGDPGVTDEVPMV